MHLEEDRGAAGVAWVRKFASEPAEDSGERPNRDTCDMAPCSGRMATIRRLCKLLLSAIAVDIGRDRWATPSRTLDPDRSRIDVRSDKQAIAIANATH